MTIDRVKEKVSLHEPMVAEEYIDDLPGEHLDKLSADELLDMSEWESAEEAPDEVVREVRDVGGGGDALNHARPGKAFGRISRHLDRDGGALYDHRWVSGFYNMSSALQE